MSLSPSSPASEPASTPPPASSVAYPLDALYARHGRPLPPLDAIEGAAIPEPGRTLLVHERDMTSTLEQFHGAGLHLRVLGCEQRGDDYFREVVLELDGTNRPVEFGAIVIHLARFSPAARAAILAGRFPLGHVLREYQVPYLSRPRAFLRVASDPFINGMLDLQGAHVLYGRRNTLLDPAGHSLAEIVEILPPA